MKSRTALICFSAVIAAGITTTLQAAKFDFDSPEAQKARKACFEKYDTNKDGILSWEEIRAGLDSQREQELIKRYDKDADGVLSDEEKVFMLKDIEEKKQKQLAIDEKNKKAALTKTPEQEAEELRARTAKEWNDRMMKFDKDGDKKLSLEEYTTMKETEALENKQRAEKAKLDAEKNLLNRCVQDKCSIPVAFFKPAPKAKEAPTETVAPKPETAKPETAKPETKPVEPPVQPKETAKAESTATADTNKTATVTTPAAKPATVGTTSSATTERSARTAELDKGNGPTVTH